MIEQPTRPSITADTWTRERANASGDIAVRYWQPTPDGKSDFLCAGLEAGPAGPHLHGEWQFAVADTPATLLTGAFRRHSVGADTVSVVKPYEVHGESGGGTWRILYVVRTVVTALKHERGVSCLQGHALSDLQAASDLRALLRASEAGHVGSSAFADLAHEWLRCLIHRHGGSNAPSAPRGPRPGVERVRKHLLDRPTEPVSLSDAVTIAGIAASHLVRSFSREVGLPPKSYHAQARLALARRLLAEGRSATWVAYECGFADQSHLNRRFKQCYRLTPGAFQAQCRKRSIADAGSNAA